MIANGQVLTTGTFVRVLKKLNPALRVCAFQNSKRLAGLYLVTKRGEWEDICGVDKGVVPPYAEFDAAGHLLVSGYRRVFWILLGNGYTTRDRITQIYSGFFDARACASDRFTGGISGDPIDNKMLRYAASAKDAVKDENGEWVEVLTDEQILDVATDIRAKDSPQQQESTEHDKWFLEKWKKNGGNTTDKPKY